MMTVLYEHTALRAGAFNVQHLRFYRGKELFVSEPHHVNPDLRIEYKLKCDRQKLL